MSDYILDIKDLKVIYKTDLETVEAVNSIDLKVKKGKTLGIVGETGAGKTTTALSIMKLLPTNTGKIVSGSMDFCGQDLATADEAHMSKIRGNRIAMVFQDPMTSLNPVMTVGDQIAEALILHNEKMSSSEINQRVSDALNMVGILPSRSIEYPHQFSGGMKQRVVIAIALACEPELLIADEPTTALDVTIQAQVLKMIKELRDRLGTSMIMITHDLGIVAKTCDDVAVMYAGEVIEAGTAEDIFLGEKHHPYTAGLFGSIPNLKSRSARLSPIPGLMPDPTKLPKGCTFSPRCKYKMPVCDEVHPAEYTGGANTHTLRCHLFNQDNKGGEANV